MTESKKFKSESKSKFLLLDILYKIANGKTPYDIYKSYGWARQRLDYWVNQLKNSNYIRLKTRSNIAIYELTLEGQNFYRQSMNLLSGSIRLHNVSFTYPIIREGDLTPERTWELNNTLMKTRKESNASVVWNHKEVTVDISSLIGDSAFELADKAKNTADDLVERLKKDYGFELGQGRLSRKPHYAVLNPVIDKISKHLEFSSDTAKIDESEGSGEVEFFEPHKVQSFITMPERLERLENNFEKFAENIGKYNENIELHLQVLHEMSETLKEIRESVRK